MYKWRDTLERLRLEREERGEGDKAQCKQEDNEQHQRTAPRELVHHTVHHDCTHACTWVGMVQTVHGPHAPHSQQEAIGRQQWADTNTDPAQSMLKKLFVAKL